MAVVVPVRTGATEGRPELYPEHVSRACRGIVEGLSNGHRAGRAPPVPFAFLAGFDHGRTDRISQQKI